MSEPTQYRISTITCNASIGTKVNLTLFFDNIILDEKGFLWGELGHRTIGKYPKKKKDMSKEKKCFDNQVTIVYNYNGLYYPNIKLFRNGNVQMTGIRNELDGIKIVEIIAEEIKKIAKRTPEIVENDNHIKADDFKIRMINSDFGFPFKIRRKNLHKLLISEKYNNICSFQPLTYPGVKLQYFWNINDIKKDGICRCRTPCYGKGSTTGECKKVTVAIFDSGKILITGANSLEQVNSAYNYICRVIQENEEELKKPNTIN